MNNIVEIKGSGPTIEKTAKAVEDVKDALFNALGEIPLSTAIGVLEIVKIEIIDEATK